MKRGLSLFLCAIMLVGLLPLMSHSAPDISSLIFTVMDRRLMSVRTTISEYIEADKLSFYSGGSYYIWSGYFEFLTAINKVNHNAERQTVTVYNQTQSVFFDYSNNITMDKQGNTYDYGAIWRGGLIFLPLHVVAQVFGLHYKHVPQSGNVIPAPILYVTSEKPELDGDSWGRNFAERLADVKKRYAADLEALEQLPDPIEPDPELPQLPPKLVYLTVTGPLDAQMTPLVLQALEETLAGQAAKAAFFIPADRESMLAGADLLRRLFAEGYPIGLLLPQGEDALAALEAGNALLRKIIFAKTRLVCLEGGTQGADPALLEALVDEGCRLWDANIIPELSGQTTPANVNTALRNGLSRASGTAVVGLESSAAALEALPVLLSYIDAGNYSLLTITDWDSPVNQAQVLQ